jgi:hypothetical protein
MRDLAWKLGAIVFFLFVSTIGLMIYEKSQRNREFSMTDVLEAQIQLANPEQTEILSKNIQRSNFVSNISCIPTITGYDVSQEFEAFGVYIKPKPCTFYQVHSLRIENDKFINDCGVPDTNIVVGKPRNEELLGAVPLEFSSTYNEFTNISQIEYFYAPCGENKGLAVLRKIKKKKGKNMEGKNITVVLMIVDSVSRQSLFRNLPQTIEFMNKYVASPLGGYSDFAIYDYLLSHSVAPRTLPNIIPILLGKHLETAQEKVLNRTYDDESARNLFAELENQAIWHDFRKNGFVTMFSYDTISDFLSTVIGRKINTDHVVSNFWHMAHQYFHYSDFSERTQCIGNAYPHTYSLNYVSQFLRNYRENNKFAYVHLSVAHEKSGKRLAIADQDLVDFFDKTLNFYKKTNQNLVFIFMSDHGRVKKTPVALESRAEQLLPFFYVIANKRLINELRGSHNLMTNTNRLVSRFDIHKTIKLFAEYPFSKYEDLVRKESEIKTEIKGYNLFFNEISEDRSCEEAGISERFCTCREFQLYTENWHSHKALSFFVYQSLASVNSYLSSKKSSVKCENLEFINVTKITFFEYEKNDDIAPIHYKMTYQVSYGVYLEVHGTTASSEKYEKTEAKGPFQHIDRYPYTSRSGVSTYITSKIWSVKRVDRNNRSIDLICEDIEIYSLLRKYLKGRGNTCNEICELNEKNCREIDSDEAQVVARLGGTDFDGNYVIESVGEEFVVTEGNHCNHQLGPSAYLCNCNL